VERPLTDPVGRLAVPMALAARPEELIKAGCAGVPYAVVSHLNGGRGCYLRLADGKAEVLVGGSNWTGTVLVAVTVTDPARSAAELRRTGQNAARDLTVAILAGI
jgi:hypothetical protein